ncbi:hypothetical protein RV15_GL001462 [Enterococcus silesiacus]|uniref:Uncharacterized protein n=1 Tax=Enterococcus silesiacus TaxID=332949 RepID=A0AA91G8N7_9ENTE|nr:hypothetical protein RV15_GL001462 [Enterococcus silesiacus]
MVGRKLQGSGSSRGEKNGFLNLRPFFIFQSKFLREYVLRLNKGKSYSLFDCKKRADI